MWLPDLGIGQMGWRGFPPALAWWARGPAWHTDHPVSALPAPAGCEWAGPTAAHVIAPALASRRGAQRL